MATTSNPTLSPEGRHGNGYPVPVDALASRPLLLRLPSRSTDDWLYELCQANAVMRIERTVEGDLIIGPPAGFKTSHRIANIVMQLVQWAAMDGTGLATESSGGFVLPDTSMFAPDAAWVRYERLDALTAEQQERFLPLCPDFVIELLSLSDSLADTEAKMRQYLANGLRLGWLIDPFERNVHVYRPGVDVEVLNDPDDVQGNPVLTGFRLEMASVW